ncbi:hypothetical protein BC936DRAFT_143154 [Jimgerdemannia flammicorona]|uniref:Uncharacterized protein n=1 Tax=Jimgerdemannia flammicorona TaxID=994334 RepID=A0A432ZZS8_9FUNG|nr:hypothetical protein BC936DRAFT_143154 [Jimgerdemannia flammicorona]
MPKVQVRKSYNLRSNKPLLPPPPPPPPPPPADEYIPVKFSTNENGEICFILVNTPKFIQMIHKEIEEANTKHVDLRTRIHQYLLNAFPPDEGANLDLRPLYHEFRKTPIFELKVVIDQLVRDKIFFRDGQQQYSWTGQTIISTSTHITDFEGLELLILDFLRVQLDERDISETGIDTLHTEFDAKGDVASALQQLYHRGLIQDVEIDENEKP